MTTNYQVYRGVYSGDALKNVHKELVLPSRERHLRIGCHLPEEKDRDTESEVTSDLCLDLRSRRPGSNYLTASGQSEILEYPCLPGSEQPRAGSVYIEILDNRKC
ncbi:hypothetical protein LSH36_472g02061 [Paralvinella palmiformis]|uniref:Uncharacterized protein n=1 Tax=Paralvinella palmiformis TaxID=53620 RepID=A0AAD9MX35_9ANNE|nr:hypothetical protein LSH36_472g02061 [Paralvinella palmiformis]